MKIYAGSDHAGFALKAKLVEHLRAQGHDVVDLGPPDGRPTDYPDPAAAVGRAVRGEAGTRGVLVCGSGIGVSIAANKIRGVRAVDAWNLESARLSRAHNDANVLCLGGRLLSEGDAQAIAKIWLETPFDGGRHGLRVDKIARIEEQEEGQRGQAEEDRAAAPSPSAPARGKERP